MNTFITEKVEWNKEGGNSFLTVPDICFSWSSDASDHT